MLNSSGCQIGRLKRIERKSSTLGMKPLKGAMILFDGKSADEFEGADITTDGLLSEGGTSRRKFQDFRLHVEFRTAYMPEARARRAEQWLLFAGSLRIADSRFLRAHGQTRRVWGSIQGAGT